MKWEFCCHWFQSGTHASRPAELLCAMRNVAAKDNRYIDDVLRM